MEVKVKGLLASEKMSIVVVINIVMLGVVAIISFSTSYACIFIGIQCPSGLNKDLEQPNEDNRRAFLPINKESLQ
jgi:hypothetical protein